MDQKDNQSLVIASVFRGSKLKPCPDMRLLVGPPELKSEFDLSKYIEDSRRLAEVQTRLSPSSSLSA